MNEQSEGWDDISKLPFREVILLDGYPYDRPMPQQPWGDPAKGEFLFEVITMEGERCLARPNETFEEGLNWMIKRMGKEVRIPRNQVVEWRRLSYPA